MTKERTISLASSKHASESASVETLLAATAQIVSAYIVNRPQEQMHLSALTAEVFSTLRGLAKEEVEKAARAA